MPSISKLQWHPFKFTVTSSSNMEPDRLSAVVKCRRSWSHRLFQSLFSSSSSSSSTLDHIQVSVEGPYGGPASSQFLRHETLVMLSGGSGITPFISIFREIIRQANKQQPDTAASSKLPHMLLICAFETSADLAVLDLFASPLSLSLPPPTSLLDSTSGSRPTSPKTTSSSSTLPRSSSKPSGSTSTLSTPPSPLPSAPTPGSGSAPPPQPPHSPCSFSCWGS